MGASQDRGHAGEQSMGFYWGERGYFLIDGPSGAGGHAANAAGFDGAAYNPSTGHLVIYDNKAFARAGNVYDASAINKNFAKNLDTLIGRVQNLSDMPQQQQVLGKLTAVRGSLDGSAVWPDKVDVAVSNASGQSTGVGGKLANGNIRFIDYYAAPSPKPAKTSADTGDAWQGPGGTPGFDQSGDALIMGAHAIIKEGSTKASMGAAGGLAWDEYLKREREIYDLQKANPCFGVLLVFHFQYQPGVNRDFADAWDFHELTINSLAGGYDGSIMELKPRGELVRFSVIIPALKARDPSQMPPSVPSPADPFWMQAYRDIKNECDSPRQDSQKCLNILNGCAMYDILRILVKLVEDRYFNYLENQLIYASGIGTARLKAAFLAVRASWNSGSAFSYYKTSCKEFGLIGEGDRTYIEEFLTGKSNAGADGNKKAPGVPDWLTGWWTAWDGNYYYYYFTDQFTVFYVKAKPSPSAPAPKTPNNKGTFTLAEHGPKIVWNPVDGSSTVETFTQRDWSSQTEMNGVSNKYSPLFAKKMV